MWDTAEEKAKFEAWKKLGAMSKAEAMHLYVREPPLLACPPGLPHALRPHICLTLIRPPPRAGASH